MSTGKILVVDDQKSVLVALQLLLQDEFEEVITLSNPNCLLSTLENHSIDVVVLDMNFSAGVNTGNEGIYWLKKILEYDSKLSIILLTAYGDVELAVKAIKMGAVDFVLKPWDNRKLITTIKTAIQLRRSKQKIDRLEGEKQTLTQVLNQSETQMIGRSKAMLNLNRIIQKVAATDVNVLILGENGTGKELIAREIHAQSARRNAVLISVDMGAVSESLFESELFGHAKGAFTDARADKFGRFELASGGTLFLDEIGNLSLAMQAKLLSVLQTRQLIRLGDNQIREIDIRLVCATNRDLIQMVADGEFREDLLYRINTIHIDVPPLRQRGEDIVVLAEFYLRKYAQKYNKTKLSFSSKTLDKLMQYAWPGNVRELKHTLEKAVILTDNDKLMADEFLFHQAAKGRAGYKPASLADMEKEMIALALEHHSGNMSRIANELGVTRPTLYNKLKKYDL
ncbi:sigma-54-dependent Fis family transcriptional regulator [Ancylomarina euxinus]|uniref:Sigma-54-dependent Fis family transcriptional regulator n=1 Tax=Ancylomarina euxinus TaxID=2283627 RepID=A0A425XXT2_9BACT|nr:sigma-54 dependent transcriptional regulator [Ancylomarina euxinus]MCZ4696024.1 sigma-54 dependent transcriptional regulator [Ancylomarina euxinus]MUP13963.1 response regulator [Ancylomarina euxinus]RRG19518.1 sigma-54-dependent Fis family transcriptional regulator [Ancylomarina euxinus]